MSPSSHKRTSRTSIYKAGSVELFEDSVSEKKYNAIWIRPGVTVLPLGNDGKVYLVREHKYAIDQVQTTCVMGGIDDGETPLGTAHRELREELGILTGKMTSLDSDEILGSRIASPQYLFLAEDISFGDTELDEEESVEMVIVPSLKEAVRMVMDGEITDAQSCLLILKAARFLGV